MKVSTIIGANAYAVIETEDGRRTDIRLSPGKSAHVSLREYAAEMRAEAARKLRQAETAERAAAILDAPQYLVAGDRLWNGAEVSHSLATAYNRLTDKIEQFKAKGRRVPEELLNGRHNLIASA